MEDDADKTKQCFKVTKLSDGGIVIVADDAPGYVTVIDSDITANLIAYVLMALASGQGSSQVEVYFSVKEQRWIRKSVF